MLLPGKIQKLGSHNNGASNILAFCVQNDFLLPIDVQNRRRLAYATTILNGVFARQPRSHRARCEHSSHYAGKLRSQPHLEVVLKIADLPVNQDHQDMPEIRIGEMSFCTSYEKSNKL